MSNSLQNDIDYMKSLAEDGGRSLVSGAALFWAGVVFGGAALVHYLFQAGILSANNTWYHAAIWIAAGVVYGIVSSVVLRGTRKAATPGTRAQGSVWAAIAFSVLVLLVCLAISGLRLGNLETVTALISPVILILYGIGWWVSAIVSGEAWLKWVCAGCFLAAPPVAWLGGQAEQMLAYVACLVLFAVIPGFVIVRRSRF